MTEQLRRGLVAKIAPVRLEGEVVSKVWEYIKSHNLQKSYRRMLVMS